MTNEEMIKAIKSNYPTSNYTMLREALDKSIELLEKDSIDAFHDKKVIVITDQDNFDQVLSTIVVDVDVNDRDLRDKLDAKKFESDVGLSVSELLEVVDVDYDEIYHNWLSI